MIKSISFLIVRVRVRALFDMLLLYVFIGIGACELSSEIWAAGGCRHLGNLFEGAILLTTSITSSFSFIPSS